MFTKTSRVIFVLLAVLWIFGVIAASVWDMDITRAVMNERSLYGRALEVAGEPPAILFTSFNLALMAAYFFKCKKLSRRDIVLGALSLVGCIGTAVFTTVKIAKYVCTAPLHPLITLYAVLAALAISLVFVMLTLFMSEETLEKYFDAALHCFIAAAATFVIIWALKLVWGRVRPRQLFGDAVFTPWYLPQGFTGYFSFPSGHTANATVVFSGAYYLRFLQKKHAGLKPLILVALGIWTALVAFSRVVVGAHFLSDVLFGAAVTVAIVYFTRPRNKNVY